MVRSGDEPEIVVYETLKYWNDDHGATKNLRNYDQGALCTRYRNRYRFVFSEYDEREQQTGRAMAEMFCDMDKPVLPHKAVNDMVYQLLWQYDDRSVGFIRVTGIREGSEACVSLHLSESLTTEREVIAEGFRHSVAKIFEKFDLKRIILVGKGRDRGIPEELLIREYGAFRIGFVHLDTEPLMYALYRAPYGGEKHPFTVWWRKLKDMYRKRKKARCTVAIAENGCISFNTQIYKIWMKIF